MRSIIARPLQLHIRAIVEDTARPQGKHSRPNDSSWLEENGHSIKTDGPKAIVWLGRILRLCHVSDCSMPSQSEQVINYNRFPEERIMANADEMES